MSERIDEIPWTDYERFETFIALAEHPDQRLPQSRATAAQIDLISDQLVAPYRESGLEGTRALILDEPEILAPLAVPEVECVTPLSVETLAGALDGTLEDREIRAVVERLSIIAMCKVYARLDVETMQHWRGIAPRSLFKLLLPQNDGKQIRHPVRRMIDFMACCAFGVRTDVAMDHVPTLAEIKEPVLEKLGGNEDRLNSWRNGRSFLTLEQAIRMWDALHGHVDREPPMPPVAMIVAATVFQSCLVTYDKGRKTVKQTLVIDNLYEAWWNYYSDELDRGEGPTKPVAWPACFDKV
ncbi:hypothetical protein [Salinisphaera sp. C84B14]|uniref:hypothetical protein n=1 Tax=Salinisphaera sp. C84B14 TaxID=1304155 RepID=UPI00333E19F7